MVHQILSDTKAVEAEAIRSEEDAQKDNEDVVKRDEHSIEVKSEDIVDKPKEKAQAEVDLVETKEAKEAAMPELEQLSNYNAKRGSLARGSGSRGRTRVSRPFGCLGVQPCCCLLV